MSIIYAEPGESCGWLPPQVVANAASLRLPGCSSINTKVFDGRAMSPIFWNVRQFAERAVVLPPWSNHSPTLKAWLIEMLRTRGTKAPAELPFQAAVSFTADLSATHL